MNILIVEHVLQELTSSTCSLLQLYFYKNIFDWEEKCKIINHETSNKKAIETILNEIFTTDVDVNEQVIEKFKKEYDLYNLFIFLGIKNLKCQISQYMLNLALLEK